MQFCTKHCFAFLSRLANCMLSLCTHVTSREEEPGSQNYVLSLGTETCCRVVQVLKFYNLEGQSKWLNLLYETCFLLLFLILAW